MQSKRRYRFTKIIKGNKKLISICDRYLLYAGKPTRALDTLYDVIKSKKRNHNYSEKLIEEIMYKYLELCVDLKKSHVAKEGLFQYRNMCQSVNVASLASVVQVNFMICYLKMNAVFRLDNITCSLY